MSKPDQYLVFNDWYKTLNWILDRCQNMPKHARFTISNRIADTSIDIIDLIVSAIYSPCDIRRQKLNAINRRLEKLRILFRLCHDRKYITPKQYTFISMALDRAGKMTGGWLKSL